MENSPNPDLEFMTFGLRESASGGEERPAEPLQVPELTPQDKGEPSPVPYSVFIKRPSPDIDPKGREQVNISLALTDLSECHLEAVPNEIRPFFRSIRQAFSNGYYRFELVVGDWSIRVYKHPNNP